MSILTINNGEYTYNKYERTESNPILYKNSAIKQLKSDPNHIESLNIIAYCHYYLSDFYQALDFALRAYNLETTYSMNDELYHTCNLLGNIYRYLGIYDTANHYYMAALNASPSHQVKEKRCQTLRYLAVAYTEMNMNEFAMDYAIEGLQLAELLNDSRLLADLQVALATLHYKSSFYDKSLKLCIDAASHYEDFENHKGLANVYLLCGDIHHKIGIDTSALDYYSKALKLSDDIKYPYGTTYANYALGCLMMSQKDFPNALDALEAALSHAKQYNIQQSKIKIYYALSDLFIQQYDYEKAYNFYKIATELNDNLKSTKQQSTIFNLYTKYNLDQKEAQLKQTLKTNAHLEALNKQLLEQVQHDSLTQLYNRRGLKNIIAYYPCTDLHTLALCDIDKFKDVNDTFGHQCGDYILMELAKVLKSNCPSNYKIARWGGEEFLILMENTSLTEATDFSKSLRMIIEDTFFTYRNHKINLTLTFGVGTLSQSFEQSIEAVDRCLYLGKNSGRNQVVFDDDLFDLV
ncbi:tetratricopeptide repeat-containing diguanylate cyclase [Petrocella sp. FN5]|uniref:tetratricopeptide repeat-containing diguanylate cyclase n=1 Tax=Petrocella sp. FN5 TaxID=3032002 RepID=UPI0023DCD175|nr:GGDEF domain-containing protein [Petrocella sp. FN5]MDF1618136.1 diguanylate cyclase [Petrocella sp. FN5]